jgi:hypothetical protein
MKEKKRGLISCDLRSEFIRDSLKADSLQLIIPRTGRKGCNRCNAPLNLKAPLSGHALNPFSPVAAGVHPAPGPRPPRSRSRAT